MRKYLNVKSSLVFGLLLSNIIIATLLNKHLIQELPVEIELESFNDWSIAVRQHECLLQGDLEVQHATDCATKGNRIVIWGDSHAASLASGFTQIYSSNPLELGRLTQSACPPLFNLNRLYKRKTCNEVNANVLSKIVSIEPELILLHSAWVHSHYPLSNSELADKVRTTITKIKGKIKATKIAVVGCVPRWAYGPMHVRKYSVLDKNLVSNEAILMTDCNKTLEKISDEMKIQFINPKDYICPIADCMLAIQLNKKDSSVGFEFTYIDYGHLSTAFSRYLANYINEKLSNGV